MLGSNFEICKLHSLVYFDRHVDGFNAAVNQASITARLDCASTGSMIYRLGDRKALRLLEPLLERAATNSAWPQLIRDVMDSLLIQDPNDDLFLDPKVRLPQIAAQERQGGEHCMNRVNGWRIEAEQNRPSLAPPMDASPAQCGCTCDFAASDKPFHCMSERRGSGGSRQSERCEQERVK